MSMFVFATGLLLSKPILTVRTDDISNCLKRNIDAETTKPLSEIRAICQKDSSVICMPQPRMVFFWSVPDKCEITEQRKLSEVLPDENALSPTELEMQKLKELLQMIPRPPSPPTRPPPPSPPERIEERSPTLDNASQLVLLGSLGAGMCALGCFLGAIYCGYRMYIRSKTIVPSLYSPPRT